MERREARAVMNGKGVLTGRMICFQNPICITCFSDGLTSISYNEMTRCFLKERWTWKALNVKPWFWKHIDRNSLGR